MKRSEMVEKISNTLLGRHCDKPNCDFCENTANAILSTAEAAGMLPPPVELKKQGHGCLCTMREGCPECDQYGKYYENKWEKENETLLSPKT